MAVLQNCIAALPSYALHALEGPCLSTLARGEDSRKSACELCGVCSCVRSARRKPFRAGGFSFHWYIASPVFVRGGIFAESENVHPQVRAQVLRGFLFGQTSRIAPNTTKAETTVILMQAYMRRHKHTHMKRLRRLSASVSNPTSKSDSNPWTLEDGAYGCIFCTNSARISFCRPESQLCMCICFSACT